MFGDWDVLAGQVFDEWRADKHIIKPFPLGEGWYKFYGLDWGYSAPYAIVKVAANKEGSVVQYGEIYGKSAEGNNKGCKKNASQAAAEAWADAVREGVSCIVADPANWNKDNGDAPSPAEYFERAGFRMVKARNERVSGWLAVHERLQQVDGEGRPLLRVFDVCKETIRTLPLLMPDKNRPEDVDSSMEDHLADALRYCLMSDFARNPQAFLRADAARALGKRGRSYNVLEYNGF